MRNRDLRRTRVSRTARHLSVLILGSAPAVLALGCQDLPVQSGHDLRSEYRLAAIGEEPLPAILGWSKTTCNNGSIASTEVVSGSIWFDSDAATFTEILTYQETDCSGVTMPLTEERRGSYRVLDGGLELTYSSGDLARYRIEAAGANLRLESGGYCGEGCLDIFIEHLYTDQ